MIAFGQAGRANRLGEQEWLPVPPGARYDPAWVAALLACVPSTVGVAAMIAVALVASPALAGILAGVLLALGLLAVLSGLEIVARERRDGVRLWLGRGPRPARYRSAV